jgi:hypothetical protein
MRTMTRCGTKKMTVILILHLTVEKETGRIRKSAATAPTDSTESWDNDFGPRKSVNL